ncbi:MAG: DNA polymerase I [Actinobacteria bacterium]|nr:DNA polymerase I [Actinomycetota bacterium]
MKKKLILIDGNNIAYRAFYALPQTIATSTGIITNAVYGFTTMVLKLIDEQKPDNIIVAFDSKMPTFRHDLFKDYKAQRKKMPDELAGQFQLIKAVLEAMSIKHIEVEGYEADDVIATLSGQLKEKFEEILIASSDKDILQLVGPNLKVMALKKGITDTVIYDRKGVIEKLKVPPEKVKDLLALTGDSSDNIPGISGIGPKSAEELVQKYGSVEEIYCRIDDIKSEKIKNLLLSNKDIAFDSKKLTMLTADLKLDINELLDKNLNEINLKEVENIFDSLEFRTLKERIKKIYAYSGLISSPQQISKKKIQNKDENIDTLEIKKIKFSIIDSDFDTELFLKNANGKLFILLYENPGNSEKYGVNYSKDLIIYNLKDNPCVFNSVHFNDKSYVNLLKTLFEDEKTIKSGIDLKEIYKYLKVHQIQLNGFFHDYRILFLLLNPTRTDIKINELIKLYAPESYNTSYIENFSSEAVFKNDLNMINDEKKQRINKNSAQMSFYSAGDMNENSRDSDMERNYSDYLIKDENFRIAVNNILIFYKLEEALLKEITNWNLLNLYEKIEEPLIKVLAEMELTGVNIDRDYLKLLIEQYDEDIGKLTDEIYGICNERFNINSPKQLSDVLFKKLGLMSSKKTKTGLSTDAATLISLLNENPVIEKILDYREKVKLKNTYIDVLPNLISPKDSRLHTTYNQLGTTTGRISSSDPNLQNIPIRTDLGRQIRKAFIPGNGYDLLMSADYSQIELRVLAHLSADEKLIEVFNKGDDIHTFTAAEIFNLEIQSVTEELRRKAKAINFGIIYGMTEYGLKSRLAISEEEAKDYIKLYFDRYPGVKRYVNFLIKEAYDKGYATTLFGRRRFINELYSSNGRLRALGERLAVNTPIQGTAADIMKLATVKLFNDIKKNRLDANILLQVHDELVLEFKKNDLDALKNIVKNAMENCVSLKVALKVDIKYGKNWYI